MKPAARAKKTANAGAKAKPGASGPKPIKARKGEKVAVVLSGGNPRIAKADGDAPVQEYIAAMPGWKRDLGKRLDALIVRNVPNVRKAVKWNSPLYGNQDFFAPRWQRATDRQQDFMKVIATLQTSDEEFSVLEIVNTSKRLLRKGFTPSHATQMLLALADKGLVYRTRRGGYAFAVPLLGQFINRQTWNPTSLQGQAS
jgi:hypothetical protein